MKKKILRGCFIACVVLGIAIQFVPLRRDNPPVVKEPRWDRPETRSLAKRACFDCHSNETRWPWYSHVAPVSWLLAKHVREGRAELNFSEWKDNDMEQAVEEIERGTMPHRDYLRLHAEARLSAEEQSALIDGLLKTEISSVE